MFLEKLIKELNDNQEQKNELQTELSKLKKEKADLMMEEQDLKNNFKVSSVAKIINIANKIKKIDSQIEVLAELYDKADSKVFSVQKEEVVKNFKSYIAEKNIEELYKETVQARKEYEEKLFALKELTTEVYDQVLNMKELLFEKTNEYKEYSNIRRIGFDDCELITKVEAIGSIGLDIAEYEHCVGTIPQNLVNL